MRLIVLMIVMVSLLLPAVPAAAQSAERCFPETGFCISGAIRRYWERNGGLPVFGFPKGPQTKELVEGVELTVQWFERDRLEIQPDGRVTAGRLGARLLELQTTPWQFGSVTTAAADCQVFRETGHQVCGAFRRFWQRNGGLERFGYPISGEYRAVLDGRELSVQYFERRRFEWHSDVNGGSVLFGLLGNEVLAASAAAVAPVPTATPVAAGQVTTSAPAGDRSAAQCSAEVNPNGVANAPIRIVSLDKRDETVTLQNVSGAAVDVSGWYICSDTGNQLHAVLQGQFAPGEAILVGRDGQANIWNNSSSDSAYLVTAQGAVAAYLPD